MPVMEKNNFIMNSSLCLYVGQINGNFDFLRNAKQLHSLN